MEVLYKKFGKKYNIINKGGILLNSEKESFLNLGFKENFTKFNGFYSSLNNEIYKIIDEFVLDTEKSVVCIEDNDLEITRVYDSTYAKVQKRVPLGSKIEGDIIGVSYGDDGNIEEIVDYEGESSTRETFFVGLTGGLIYNINNFYGNINVDLDIRKGKNFSEWGRYYDVYKENDIIIVEFEKKIENEEKSEYKVYVAFRIPNSEIKIKKEWIKKEYFYDKERNSDFIRYVFRGFSFKVLDYKRVYIGVGLSKEDALKEIKLLTLHEDEVKNIKKNFFDRIVSFKDFNKLVPEEVLNSYYLAYRSYYGFFNKDYSGRVRGMYAGFPWFTEYWSRDTLVSLRPLINDKDFNLIKSILYDYLDQIDEKNIFLRNYDIANNYSLDGTFWLIKRLFDLIYKVEEKKKLSKYFNNNEMNILYEKLRLIFNNIIIYRWDKENELIKVKWAETWMDTIERTFPLEIQVMFLELLQGLCFLGKHLGKDEKEVDRFQDLEFLMRANIREKYFRNGMLYDEPYENKVTNNVFLAYYFYPDLLYKEDWDRVFEKAINHLWCDWGGFSSLSKKDSRYQPFYTGEDNRSYHQGDSWFFVNNIAAICMNHLDKRKYNEFITKVFQASKDDLLKQGFLGNCSEVSSAEKFSPEGCFGQLWSCATFIELVDNLYEKK